MARAGARPDITFLPLASGYPALMAHHRHLLDDQVRTGAFLRALRRVIHRDDVVADLGTGTGVLAVAARKAGARAVYAIDVDLVVRLAETVARDSGITGITWIHGDARSVSLPEPVDVVVSECLGVLGVGGTMVQALVELRDRSLRDGGLVVPRGLSIHLAPVEAAFAHRYVTGWTRPRYGLDLSAAARLACHNLYNFSVDEDALLAAPVRVLALDLARDFFTGNTALTTVELTATRAGRMHGWCGWFDADLCPGVVLSTAPWRRPTVWRQVFLPLPSPLRVRTGDRIVLGFATRAGQRCPDFEWTTEVRVGKKRVRHEQSTRGSFPAVPPGEEPRR